MNLNFNVMKNSTTKFSVLKTIDEPIKEGDWYLYNSNNDSKKTKWVLLKAKKVLNDGLYEYIDTHVHIWCKKILTTNKS